jgi:hypothetical protein
MPDPTTGFVATSAKTGFGPLIPMPDPTNG